MYLGFDARVLNHGPGVGLEAGHGAADVGVDFDDFFDGGGFEEGGGDALFDADYDALAGGNLWGVSWLVGWREEEERGGRRRKGEGGGGKGGERITPMAVEPSLMASREYST